MSGPLIERFPPGAEALAGFDASVGDAEHRRALTTDFQDSSKKRHARAVRRYGEWCHEVGYQIEPDTSRPDQMSERVREYTVYMTTVKRYAVSTVWTHIRAVELFMQRHGVEVSVEPAMGVVDDYRRALAPLGAAKAPTRQRRRAQ